MNNDASFRLICETAKVVAQLHDLPLRDVRRKKDNRVSEGLCFYELGCIEIYMRAPRLGGWTPAENERHVLLTLAHELAHLPGRWEPEYLGHGYIWERLFKQLYQIIKPVYESLK